MENFQITAGECMAGMSCKSYNTYKKCLDNLIEWGFVKLVRKSYNQYQCNVIALSNFDNSLYKALDKALIKHCTKQSESTVQSTDDIHKQQTIKPKTNKPKTNKQSSSAKAKDTDPKITERFLTVYNSFLQSRIGTDEQFSIAGRAGLKKTIDYLKTQVRNKHESESDKFIEDNAVLSWEWILSNFEYWEPFHQNQLKLEQINSNLLNIIQSSRKKKTNGKQISPEQVAAESFAHLENLRNK